MTVDLERLTGLPLALEEPARLLFGGGIPPVEPAERPWEELRPVLKDPETCPRGTAYWMYRDLCRPEDRGALIRAELRYDLTVIPSGRAGEEPVRTHGHYHALVPGQPLTYPELYQVVRGEAWFLLQRQQRPGVAGSAVAEAVLVKARAGEYVLVPPDFGHVTVNPGGNTLVIANWVQRTFSSSFAEMRRSGGAAYHVLNGRGLRLEPNPAYGSPVPLRVVEAFSLASLGFPPGGPSYLVGANHPHRLEFLVRPQDYRELLAEVWQAGR